jgi:hypothetical protein
MLGLIVLIFGFVFALIAGFFFDYPGNARRVHFGWLALAALLLYMIFAHPLVGHMLG